MPKLATQHQNLTESGLGDVARMLAPLLAAGDCIQLVGTLGAGKTAFSRALIRALSGTECEVSSPTFTLLQSYPIMLAGAAAECWHADLYRLESPSALEELGLYELAARGVLCVEWPEIAEGWLPKNILTLTLEVAEDDTQRHAHFSAPTTSRWHALLQSHA